MPSKNHREFLHGDNLRAFLGLHIHGVLDGIGGDDGGVVVGGVGGEAVGDDADGHVPLDDDVASRGRGAAPDAGDADAGLAVPALELEAIGHGHRRGGRGQRLKATDPICASALCAVRVVSRSYNSR